MAGLLFAASILILVGGPGSGTRAGAVVHAIGASQATRCFGFAKQGLASREAIDVCGLALAEELLTDRHRAGTHVNRGVLHMNRRDHPAAAADFEAALRIAPDLGEAYFNRGSLHMAEGRLAQGVADINESLRLGFAEPEKAYYNRGMARERLADTRGAYNDYREAARLKPDWKLPQAELTRFTVSPR